MGKKGKFSVFQDIAGNLIAEGVAGDPLFSGPAVGIVSGKSVPNHVVEDSIDAIKAHDGSSDHVTVRLAVATETEHEPAVHSGLVVDHSASANHDIATISDVAGNPLSGHALVNDAPVFVSSSSLISELAVGSKMLATGGTESDVVGDANAAIQVSATTTGLSEGSAVEAGMFLARVVYGDWAIPDAYNGADNDDNGYDDDYEGYISFATGGSWNVLTTQELGSDGFDGSHGFTSGGLYLGTEAGIDTNYAEALAVEAVIDGQNTIILSFRGSDGKDAGYEGQTWTSRGSANYYTDLQPLIWEILEYASDPANNIDQVIVAGHSLGGAMADIFAITDAQLFVDAGIDLTVVSVASAGIDPLLPNKLDLDESITEINTVYDGLDIAGQPVTHLELVGVTEPTDFNYVSFNHSLDPVRYPELVSQAKGSVLEENINFGSDYEINLPNIDFKDTRGTFGAQHNGGIYWVNVQALFNDALFTEYTDQNIIMGISDYSNATDYNGTPIALVPDWRGPTDNDINGLGTSLVGTASDDYILGLTGIDSLSGKRGNDLLSGGDGDDFIKGGGGSDYLDGGEGIDRMSGGASGDFLISLGDGDLLTGGQGADVFEFSAMAQGATITDFETGADKIDLEALGVTFADLGFASTVDGAVIYVAGGEILVSGVPDLTEDDFILGVPSWPSGEFSIPETTQGNQTGAFSVLLGNGNVVVAWNDYSETSADNDGASVHFRVYSSDSSPVTGELLVNESYSGDQVVFRVTPTSDGGFWVFWREENDNGTTPKVDTAYARLYDSAGLALTSELPISEGFDRDYIALVDVVKIPDAGFVTIWQGRYSTDLTPYFQLVDADGNVQSELLPLDGISNSQVPRDLIVSPIDSGFVVSYVDDGIKLGFFSFDAEATSEIISADVSYWANSHQSVIDVLPNGNIVVASYYVAETVDGSLRLSIEAEVISPDGGWTSGVFQVDTRTMGSLEGADNPEILALSDGTFVVFWGERETDDLLSRHFDGEGNALSDPLKVNTTEWSYGPGGIEATELEDGSILINWNQYMPSYDVVSTVVRFNAAGDDFVMSSSGEMANNGMNEAIDAMDGCNLGGYALVNEIDINSDTPVFEAAVAETEISTDIETYFLTSVELDYSGWGDY